MEQRVVIADTVYKIEAASEAPEQFAQLAKAMDIYYDIREKYNTAKEEFELAHYRMEQMFGKGFEEVGLKKMGNKYMTVTYVPATEGNTKTVKEINVEKLRNDLEELGLNIDDYMMVQTKTTGKRKAFIKVSE